MPEITLPAQKAEKVIKPPVKSLQLGDGYEQTFQNAIADVEEWNVTTPPMDDTDANSLEDLLNGLNGDTFTWTPPFSDQGTYRLNSKTTRTMVSYTRSTLQFSLKKANLIICTPQTLNFTDSLTSTANWSIFSTNTGTDGLGAVDVAIVSSKWRTTTTFVYSCSQLWISNFSYAPQFDNEILNFNFSINAQMIVNQSGTGQLFNFFLIQNGLAYPGGFQTLTSSSSTTIAAIGDLVSFGASLLVGVPIYLAIGFGNATGGTLRQNTADYWDFVCTIDVTCG